MLSVNRWLGDMQWLGAGSRETVESRRTVIAGETLIGSDSQGGKGPESERRDLVGSWSSRSEAIIELFGRHKLVRGSETVESYSFAVVEGVIVRGGRPVRSGGNVSWLDARVRERLLNSWVEILLGWGLGGDRVGEGQSRREIAWMISTGGRSQRDNDSWLGDGRVRGGIQRLVGETNGLELGR